MSNQIAFKRVKNVGRRDHFEVRIDGEHRATFRPSTLGKGYDLYDTNRQLIASRHSGIGYSYVSQDQFEYVVTNYLAKGKIVTVAEQAFDKLFHEAVQDNRMFDDERDRRRRELRRFVLADALTLYLERGDGTDERFAMAKKILQEIVS